MTAPRYTPPATSCVCRTSFCSGQPFCTYCSSSQPRNSRRFNCLAREPFIFGQQTMTKPTTRRLSSGSACETCRRRKTKCDGGQPCAYCATNGIECLHRASKKRSGQHLDNRAQTALMMGWPVPDKRTQRSISPQQDWLRIDPLRSSSRLGKGRTIQQILSSLYLFLFRLQQVCLSTIQPSGPETLTATINTLCHGSYTERDGYAVPTSLHR